MRLLDIFCRQNPEMQLDQKGILVIQSVLVPVQNSAFRACPSRTQAQKKEVVSNLLWLPAVVVRGISGTQGLLDNM